MEPSVIAYWKGGKWVRVKRIFYTEEEIREWYKHMRPRIDGLTIVKPLSAEGQTTLDASKDPAGTG